MKKYRFPVVIEQDEDGMYVALVPDLKGCHTQARTLPLLEKRIKEAMRLCLSMDRKTVTQNRFVGVHQLEVAL